MKTPGGKQAEKYESRRGAPLGHTPAPGMVVLESLDKSTASQLCRRLPSTGPYPTSIVQKIYICTAFQTRSAGHRAKVCLRTRNQSRTRGVRKPVCKKKGMVTKIFKTFASPNC